MVKVPGEKHYDTRETTILSLERLCQPGENHCWVDCSWLLVDCDLL